MDSYFRVVKNTITKTVAEYHTSGAKSQKNNDLEFLLVLVVVLFILLIVLLVAFCVSRNSGNALFKKTDSYRPVSTVDEDDNQSTNSASSVAKKKALLDTFLQIMEQGILVKLHTVSGPKEVRLSVGKNGNELHWESANDKANPGTGKRYKLDLNEVKTVVMGKKTANFIRATSIRAHEDVCFSLVCDRISMDIEVNRKVERDSLAQGFALLIEKLTAGVAILQDEKDVVVPDAYRVTRGSRSVGSAPAGTKKGSVSNNRSTYSMGAASQVSDLTWESGNTSWVNR